MSAHPRVLLRVLASRCFGERPIPVGDVAFERRLLRRALRGQAVGRVLVVGPGLAARQAFPDSAVDVAGTSPHSPEVTVCSAVRSVGSLPPSRWDTVIISEPAPDLGSQLEAIAPACRPNARLVVLDRGRLGGRFPNGQAFEQALRVQSVVGRFRRRALVATVAR